MAQQGPPRPPFAPGQQPTPEQIQMMQQQFAAEAAKQGLTPQQFAEKIRAAALAQQQQQQQQMQAQGQGQPGAAGGQQAQGPPRPPQQQGQPQQVPIQPGPPKPEALAVATFLKSQNLKSRPCILQEKRREMFKVKRAIRALQSPAYEKARSKNPLLPAVTDRASAENTFKLLPLSMLAIRVTRIDPSNPAHGQPGHQHDAKIKSQKGKDGKKLPWTVRIEQQQDAADPYHYAWFYEGNQWRQKAYALAALLGVIAVVLFPLWPLVLRQGVWYLSVAAIGVLCAFFGLAIVRLIIFVFTVAVGPQPGIWIYPNLFEDVGFFDSFRPMWAWRETKESVAAKKAEKKAKKQAKRAKGAVPNGAAETAAETTSAGLTGATGAEVEESGGTVAKRNLSARVEEVEDE